MKRFRRLRRWWPAMLVVFLALLVYAAWPGSSTFTISKETTYITEPIDADGFVDYPTALNQRMSQGITPENNANVLIWQALGPHPEGGTMPPEYFKWLGIDSPPEQGEYFIGRNKYFEAFVKDNLNEQSKQPAAIDGFRAQPDRKQHWENRVGRANKWPWKRADQPDIADWLKRNEKALALTVQASKRPQYFHPLVSESPRQELGRMIGSLQPNVAKSRELAAALACRAMARVADDDFDGAWQDLLACQQLGRLMTRCATTIESLTGIAIISIATNAQVVLLGQRQHSAKQIHAWRADLRKLLPLSPISDKLDLGDRFAALDGFVNAANLGAPRLHVVNGRARAAPPNASILDRLFTWSIDFDQAFRNLNRHYDEFAAAARLPNRTARKAELSRLNDEIELRVATKGSIESAYIGKVERGEKIGNILISLMIPTLQKLHDTMDRVEQTQANLQVAFALAAYRADTGRYPVRLDDLAPKYLPTIPGDLFSGKPLIYRPTENGYLLYSVGVNGIDEDGRWMDDDPPGDDLRVRMPMVEPPMK
jgi:hypothetical protein